MKARALISLALLFCLSSVGSASSPQFSPPSLAGALRKSLPEKLQAIIPGKTSRAEVLKRLGSPGATSKRNSLLYKIGEREFDTTIGFEGDKVQYLYHEPDLGTPLGELRLESVKSLIPKEALAEAKRKLRAASPTHETGRSLEIAIPSEGLKLEFRNNSARDLRSIIFSVPGARK